MEDGWSILGVNKEVSVDRNEVYQKIRSLEIPERIKKVGIKSDQVVYNKLSRAMALGGFPSMLLAFGHSIETSEEVVILYTVAGIAPEEALAKIQSRARERAVSLQ